MAINDRKNTIKMINQYNIARCLIANTMLLNIKISYIGVIQILDVLKILKKMSMYLQLSFSEMDIIVTLCVIIGK